MRDVTTVMAWALVIEIAAAIVSASYVLTVYMRSTRQSTIFRMVVTSDIIKVIAGLWIGFLAVYRLADFGVALPEWTALISGPVVGVLLAPPILHAVTFRRLRRRYGDGTPPPLHPGD